MVSITSDIGEDTTAGFLIVRSIVCENANMADFRGSMYNPSAVGSWLRGETNVLQRG